MAGIHIKETRPVAPVNHLAESDSAAKKNATGENPNAGPTVEEFVKAGYNPNNYPPQGYNSKSTPEEIAAAIAAYDKKNEGGKSEGGKAKVPGKPQ